MLIAVSVSEIAIKNSTGKLSVTSRDVVAAIADLKLLQIGFESRHARTLFNLPVHHRDPFDRMLIATALCEDVPLLSGDRTFKKYRGLRLLN